MNKASNLVIKDLNKSYGAVHVVKDLNLSVEPGEFLVLLGPSGCGKTTALRMIAGLEEIDSGTITLGENDVTNMLPKYRDVAMVFQSYALYPHKTVAENIGFPLKMRGVEPTERAAAVRDAAEQVQMEELLQRYPRQLSGGQRQRVALARAIVRRPSVFLMDEPLSNLDAQLRGHMRAELKHMQQELGVTTIYVTHDQIEAMTLAHRVAIINDGRLQQVGTPNEVYSDPANLFVAGFMGAPPMNFIEGVIENGEFVAGYIKVAVTSDKNLGQAVLGFRPEDTELVAAGQGHFDASIYTVEHTGEQTLVTILVAGNSLAVKMPKEFEATSNSKVGVQFADDAGYIFDLASGERNQTCSLKTGT